MDVAYGTGNYASLYPQPKSDTQSVTASGQWSASKSNWRTPHPREPERQALLWAARSGRLAFRRIYLNTEKQYFSGKGSPRPFSLVLPGGMMPTKPIPKRYCQWMVGIVDPQCLYVYKCDAYTQRLLLEPGLTPEQLRAKLLPDLPSMFYRRREHGEQVIWRAYPHRFTSGHLRKDGTFSLPKLKPGNDTPVLDYPELVLTKYGKEDIKCIVVYLDAQINIADTLWHKRQCEEVLGLESLPLVVYCHRTGSVQVNFDGELDSKHLAKNEDSLDYFAISQGIPPENFRAMLNLLPMSLRTQALGSELTVSPDVEHKLQQAIQLVSDPGCYSYEKLLGLKQSGLPIHQPFFHKGSFESLLEMLLTSEMCRYSHPEQKHIKKQEKEAYRMFQLLLHSGASLPKEWCVSFIYWMDRFDSNTMPLGIMNCMLAAFSPFDFLTLLHLRQIPLTCCPGAVVEFDRICQGLSQQQRQDALEEIVQQYVKDCRFPTLDTIKSHLLALFYSGASLNKNFMKSFKSNMQKRDLKGKMIVDDFSPNDYTNWLDNLWKQRETYLFYQHWPEHVQWARRENARLKQSLHHDDPGTSATSLAAESPAALQFLVNAFSEPPVLPDHVGDNEKTILTVLQHYYRRPGPERVIKSLARQTMPTVWKPQHSCSHVLRARNNGLWYMELLEKFQLCRLKKIEKELLALAIIFHDAAAEDVDKSAEETRSAGYFKRDLTGHYPELLLGNIAQAMVSKENDTRGKDEQNLPDPVRWYLRILRFADRLDIIRCYGVGADFPGFTVTEPPGFDAARLDLPPKLTGKFTPGPGNKGEFQRHLEAAMHGAADLARITTRLQDHRKKDYTEVYGLNEHGGSRISENFEWTTEPVQRMMQFIDDNVRRKMAREAGIIVCSDPGHRACKADQNKGVTYGIHNSWYDLRQVAIPTGMTLLEKMQYEHDPSLLSPATQQALAQEVQRLKSEGIRMNPGTLTQETLASEEARKVLKKRGIAVISEKRPYFTDNGSPREWPMLVPKKILKLGAPQNAPAGWACTTL
ncbi:hypothetical protein [Salinisphaera sp. G21_0]|uniref:hypothetical protein n=1 Tax=Salinisphaera sp. G21_0 TaxID=2821094 RepID=UPI001ADB911D|nr:hypothetical protein [Salinisphaera sp. G21_0]MBO9481041.1 hypothetical protein [Salinisphaera sp. G21_0]